MLYSVHSCAKGLQMHLQELIPLMSAGFQVQDGPDFSLLLFVWSQ